MTRRHAVIDRIAYSPYGEATRTLRSDVNGDGFVNQDDYAGIIKPRTGAAVGTASYVVEADLDRDGKITQTDYDISIADDGKSSSGGVGEAGLFSRGVRNSIGYCGYIYNEDSGLYTVRFRTYSPTLGRWLERDPAGYVDGMDLYEYVRGGAIDAVDPWGLQAFPLPRPLFTPRPMVIPRFTVPELAIPRPVVFPPLPISMPVPIQMPVDGSIPILEELPELKVEDATVAPYYPPPDGGCRDGKNPCGNLVSRYKDLEKELSGKTPEDAGSSCQEAMRLYAEVARLWRLRWQADRCHEHHGISDGNHAPGPTTDLAKRRQKFFNKMKQVCNNEIRRLNDNIRIRNEKAREYNRKRRELEDGFYRDNPQGPWPV